MFYCSREIIRKFLGKNPASAASGPTAIIASVPTAEARAIEYCCRCSWCFRGFLPPFFLFLLPSFFFSFFLYSLHTTILALPEYLLSNAFRTSSAVTLVICTVIILDRSTLLELCSVLFCFGGFFYMLENGMQMTGESLIFFIT